MNKYWLSKSFNAAKEPKAISIKRALKIFDELADDASIAFGYPRDGCFARAHIMCTRLHETGILPKKAWAFEKEKKLCVKTEDNKEIKWWYHVAAAIPVSMPNGKTQSMVIDPSLFDGPVSLTEWGKIMGATPSQLEIQPLGKSPKYYSGDYGPHEPTTEITDIDAKRVMENYLNFQDDSPRKVFQSQIRQQQKKKKHPENGKTWITQQTSPPTQRQNQKNKI